MKRNDIREIQVGDEFYCRRESGREYTGTVRAVKIVKGNGETMVTVYIGHDDDDIAVYRNFYPCDCAEWTAEKPVAMV